MDIYSVDDIKPDNQDNPKRKYSIGEHIGFFFTGFMLLLLVCFIGVIIAPYILNIIVIAACALVIGFTCYFVGRYLLTGKIL